MTHGLTVAIATMPTIMRVRGLTATRIFATYQRCATPLTLEQSAGP
jgi:hypothetical protein